MEHREVGPRNRTHSILNMRNPRHGEAIVKAQRQFHAYGEASAKAFHNPHHIGVLPADRHEIRQPYGPIRMLKGGFQNQG